MRKHSLTVNALRTKSVKKITAQTAERPSTISAVWDSGTPCLKECVPQMGKVKPSSWLYAESVDRR